MYNALMTLQEYLAETRQTPEVFAEKLGIAGRSVRRYLSNDRKPDFSMLAAIRTATDGRVTPNDFLGPAQ